MDPGVSKFCRYMEKSIHSSLRTAFTPFVLEVWVVCYAALSVGAYTTLK